MPDAPSEPDALAPPMPPLHMHVDSAGAAAPAVGAGADAGGAGGAVYELYAVLVHAGSASFGHYYALIKDVENGEWHEFNDATVKPIKESELQRAWGGAGTAGGWGATSSAYMLMYRRKEAPTAATATAPPCVGT